MSDRMPSLCTRIQLLLTLCLASMVISEVLEDDTLVILPVTGEANPGGLSWADSYSIGDSCFCSFSTFDHGLVNFWVETPLGWMTLPQLCEKLGPGPGMEGRPLYNDVQCGNGPPNDAGDEHTCPGRVDMGPEGCGHIGPRWNFAPFLNVTASPTPQPTSDPTAQPTASPTPEPTFGPPIESGGFFEPPILVNFGKTTPIVGFQTPDEAGLLEGAVRNYGGSNEEIGMTTAFEAYSSHSWSFEEIVYTLVLDPQREYTVTAGFAESYEPNCNVGKRVFNLEVGSQSRNDIDVFKEAGCKTAYNIQFSYVRPAASGNLTIRLTRTDRDNPFISTLEVMGLPPSSEGFIPNTGAPSQSESESPTRTPLVPASEAPSRSPSGSSASGLPVVKVQFGAKSPVEEYDDPNLGSITTGGTLLSSIGGGVVIQGTTERAAYASHMWSHTYIAYSMDLEPSTAYDVRLGFAETYEPNCGQGRRLFNVKVGNKPMMENVDIWKEAGCKTAHDVVFYDVQADSSGVLLVNVTKGEVENPYIALLEVTHSISGSGPMSPSSAPTSTPAPPSALPIAGFSDNILARVSFGGAVIEGFDGTESGSLTGNPGINRFGGEGVQIAQSGVDNMYASHVWSWESLTYSLQVDASREYTVKVLVAESFTPNCFVGQRVFNLVVGDQLRENVDVFKEAGCETAHDIVFTNVKANLSGKLEITGLKLPEADNPFMSGVEVSFASGSSETTTMVPSFAPSMSSSDLSHFPTYVPTTMPSSVPILSEPIVKVQFGRDEELVGDYSLAEQLSITGEVKFFEGYGISINGASVAGAYASHMWSDGKAGYEMILDPARTYDVKVGFAESYNPNCNVGKRVFDLRVGDEIVVTGIDVFKEAGCKTAYDMVFQNVKPLGSGSLEVAVYRGESDNAFMSLLEVSLAS